MAGKWANMLKGRQLLFNILFHGFHIAIFAIGWYVGVRIESSM